MQNMTRRQCHLIDFVRVPSVDNDSPTGRVRQNFADSHSQLICRTVLKISIYPAIVPPLRPVNPAEIVVTPSVWIPEPVSVLVGIGVPDGASQVPKSACIFISQDESQQFSNNLTKNQVLGCHRWKTIIHVERQRSPGNAQGRDAGSVLVTLASIENVSQQVEILSHALAFGGLISIEGATGLLISALSKIFAASGLI